MEKIQQAIERARQQRASLTREPGRAGAVPPLDPVAARSLEGRLDAIPTVALDENHLLRSKVVAAVPKNPLADIFRALRTQMMLRLESLNGRSIAVVSARNAEGKTLVATNLAFSMARRAEAPVFLIDLDFRRPSVAANLGVKSTKGTAELIEGRAEFVDVALRIEGTNLYVLTQPYPVEHASELIGSTRARDLMSELLTIRGAYVIADCPPLLLTDEPLAVQTFVDGVLLVVQQGRTTRDEVERATSLIDEAKYLGSVMNRAETDDASNYYGYR